LRLIDPDPGSDQEVTLQGTQTANGSGTSGGDFDPDFYPNTVAGSVTPQAADPDGNYEAATGLYIITEFMPPDGSVNDPYDDFQLFAEGGTEPLTWSLVPGYENLPPGLELTSGGIIGLKNGFDVIGYDPDPPYDYDEENDIYWKTYNFAVKATDGEQIAYRSLSIKVILYTHEIIATAGPNGSIDPAGTVEVFHGFDQPFDIIPDECYEINEVFVDSPLTAGPLTTYTFEDVREDHTINATFRKIAYTITPTASTGGGIYFDGGLVTSDVTVYCGDSPVFTITPNDCFHIQDVLVDGSSVGAVTSYKFTEVDNNHTIHAVFDRDTFTITAAASYGGSINPAGEVIVDCGTDKTFTITPDEGFRVLYVIVDEGMEWEDNLGPVNSHQFTNVRGDHTIEATFGWIRRYNNVSVNGNDEPSDIGVDPSGNVYVTGYSLGSPTGNDYYTIGYNSVGTEVLTSRYDGPAHQGDKATAIAVDNEGATYVTGFSFRGMPHKHSDYSTVKYDSFGNEAWDARYDARRNGMDAATDITLGPSGNYVYITGRSQDSESKKSDVLHYDYYTIKYNANTGKIERGWGARYNNGLGNGDDEATAIAVDLGGNVYVTGKSEQSSESTEPIYDYATVKYLPNGNVDTDWGVNGAVRYETINNDEAVAIAVDNSQNVYVTGFSSNGTDNDYVTIKYDSDGNPDATWGSNGVIRYDGLHGDDAATAIILDKSGNVYVTGFSSNGTDNDYVTIKYGSNGSIDTDWGSNGVVRYHGGHGDDAATSMVLDDSGNVYVTGRSQGDGTGFDFCTLKYDSGTGDVVWTDRYNNYPVNGDDEAIAIAIDPVGNIYITGRSEQSSGTTRNIEDLGIFYL
jgi:uncharacterized delta-60 repeat protein